MARAQDPPVTLAAYRKQRSWNPGGTVYLHFRREQLNSSDRVTNSRFSEAIAVIKKIAPVLVTVDVAILHHLSVPATLRSLDAGLSSRPGNPVGRFGIGKPVTLRAVAAVVPNISIGIQHF